MDRPSDHPSAVIDLFSGKPWTPASSQKIIRISPELDGLEMLYSNDSSEDRLFSTRLLFWGLRADGEVVGLVPWLDRVQACPDIRDALNGRWEGYYDPDIDEIFDVPPEHKVLELKAAAAYYDFECDSGDCVAQEIIDSIGTHAVFTNDGFRSLTLTEVLSWRLLADGHIQGMVIDEEQVVSTPVLPGDDCLYPAQSDPDFRYFFQHRIANKIKAQDPDALAAIALLTDG